MRTKKRTLVDELIASPPSKGCSSWKTAMPQFKYTELLAVRDGWQAGKLRHKSKAELFAVCQNRLGLPIGISAFRQWLEEHVA